MSLSQIRLAGARCGQVAHIDNAVSPERVLGLRSIRNWFTSTLRLMKSVQVKLQSSWLDMHFGESLLELTPVCRPQLKPGGKLSYKAQHERDRWPLWQLYSLCLPFITPAEERQLIELKRRLKWKKNPYYSFHTLVILKKLSPMSAGEMVPFKARLENFCHWPFTKWWGSKSCVKYSAACSFRSPRCRWKHVTGTEAIPCSISQGECRTKSKYLLSFCHSPLIKGEWCW